MNRDGWKRLSNERVRDAKALLAAKRWAGAYYLTGYAVECALKACVMRLVEETGVIFKDRKFVDKCWTHDLKALVVLLEWDEDLEATMDADADFSENWAEVKYWNETSRYQRKSRRDAERLFRAVTDKTSGVLPWVKSRW